ncbi:hypothetical protein P6F26_16885 [Roseibacterium sp. SDUM158017]|uniref:hypothetical protein n=1 Tax=Roseicyclus salinarum TaxID=3036773 RepID=UPI002415127A|nr:hypothetical protein [Roseibacterium sp. SDUM158017]MDG4650126.1 hypothetical protein [Roseibacterium sp. SDUM158017]
MRRLVLELGSIATRTINVLTGGDADTAFSARVHIEEWRRIERVIDALFSPWGTGHCRKAWLDDVERARAQIERHEEREAR